MSNKRISLEAKEILQGLFQGSTQQSKALRGSKSLAESDLIAVFSEITNRLNIEEDLREKGKLNVLLVKFCQLHPILITEYCAFMENAAESTIMPASVPNLIILTKDTPFKSTADLILAKWSKSSNKMLAKAANDKL
ncbi:MAG: hypothetical protein KDC67_16920 [Ignavibacteriae bacterium]|nr:hypothetical protein [Ignavibacteriota bacterium]